MEKLAASKEVKQNNSRELNIEAESGKKVALPTLEQLKYRLDELDHTSSLHKCSWRVLTNAIQAIAENDPQKQKSYLMRSQWGF